MDTIVLRLHNLKKYHWFVMQIVSKSSGYYFHDGRAEVHTELKEMLNELVDNYKNHGVIITDKDIEQVMHHKFDKINHPSQFLNFKAVFYQDTQQSRYPVYRNRQKMRSSNYDLTTTIFFDGDYVEFNFSVPKFLYGTNVFQFVSHTGEHNFDRMKDQYSEAMSDMYERFMYFVKNFFNKNFIIDEKNFYLDYMDLELNRIDFAWNCIFNSEEDAKLYLKCIMHQHFKGTRKGGENIIEHEESRMAKTQGYSRKVYHKGPEFRKNDAKELEKNNIFPKEKIEQLQEIADKTLRFEVTLRKKHLSYMYQTKLWRKKSVQQNTLRKLAKEGRKFAEIKRESYSNYVKLCQDYKISKDEKTEPMKKHYPVDKDYIDLRIRAFEDNQACDNFRRMFVLGKNKGVDFYNESFHELQFDKKGQLKLNKEVCLNKEIFELWHSFLLDFVRDTEVKSLPSIDLVKQKVKNHNEAIENYKWVLGDTKKGRDELKKMGKHKKVVSNRIFRYIEEIRKLGFDEFVRLNMYDRTTIWRLKKDLDTLGINYKNPSQEQAEKINVVPDYIFEWRDEGRLIRPSGGFHKYNMFILFNFPVKNRTYC